MCELLTIGAWIAICSTFIISVYLGYKEATKPPELTFLELFLYMENMRETLEKITEEEAKETRREIFQSELRNYDRIRRQFKKHTPDS